jgi:hypothetical protein
MFEKIIKLILAILFFVCLAKMPYNYYEFIRFIALVAFAFLSYESYQEGNKGLAFIYAALALLFQPLFKIYLGRTLWNIIDVIVALFLIATIFYPKRREENN